MSENLVFALRTTNVRKARVRAFRNEFQAR